MTDEQLQAINEWVQAALAELREVLARIASAFANWGRGWFPALLDYARVFALARHEVALLRARQRYVAMSTRQRKDARRRTEKRTRLSPA